MLSFRMPSQVLRPDPAKYFLFTPSGILFTILWTLFYAVYWTPKTKGDDWTSLWIAGILIRDNNWQEAYSISPTDFSLTGSYVWDTLLVQETTAPFAHPFVHNPGVGVFMALYTSIASFTVSMYILTTISALCVPVLVAASYRFWTFTPISPLLLVPASLIIGISEPFVMSLALGQTTPLILTCCVVAMVLAYKRPVIAAILISFATFVKLTPIIAVLGLALVPTTRKAGMYALGILSIWFAALYILLFGPFMQWSHALKGHSSSYLVSPINASISSVIYSAKRTNEGVAVVRDVPTFPVAILVLMLVTVTGILFAKLWWDTRVFPSRVFLTLCLLGPMAVAQILWIHYSFILVFPLIGILVWGYQRKDNIAIGFVILATAGMTLPFNFLFPATYNPVMLVHTALWVLVVVTISRLNFPLPVQGFEKREFSGRKVYV